MMGSQSGFGVLNYIVLFAYLGTMMGVGALFAGSQKTTEDYFLAGRRMPWLVVGMSMFASVTSAISYMGIPGTAYKENLSLLVVAFLSPLVAPFLIFVFYPFYRLLNVTTSYEYVLRRYGQPARLTVSGLFVLGRLGWLGTVILRAGARAVRRQRYSCVASHSPDGRSRDDLHRPGWTFGRVMDRPAAVSDPGRRCRMGGLELDRVDPRGPPIHLGDRPNDRSPTRRRLDI